VCCGEQSVTYHGYFVGKDELNICLYVYDWVSLLIVVCLSINNPNKECIIVPFIIKVAFVVYAATSSFCCFPIFKVISSFANGNMTQDCL